MAGTGEQQIEFRREALPSPAALEQQWRALEAVAESSFFTSWRWIGAWLAILPETSRPALLRGLAAGQTVALVLLGASTARRRRGLVHARGLHVNETGDPSLDVAFIEHNNVLTARGHEARALDALVGWFAGSDSEADELYISGSLSRLPHSAVEGRGLLRTEILRPSYSLDLGPLAEAGGELYPALSANARQQLRRAMRHFETTGPVRLQEAKSAAEALDFFARLKALHVAAWERRGKPHAFAGEFFDQFHRRLIEEGVDDGAVQLLEASAGDRPFGYLYNFRKGDRVYAYQSGFAYEDHQARPGAVAHALAIRHAFRAGARVYDFLAGHNRLKESFATQCEPMLWQVVQRPLVRFRLERLARRLRQAARPG